MAEKLHILQVNSNEISGGAQKVARNLFQFYRAAGHASWLAVSHKLSADPDILLIPNTNGEWGWSRLWWSVHARCLLLDSNGRFSRWAQRLAEPEALVDHFRGVENFHYPGTWRLLGLTPRSPDVLHCHNLHGDYFDLRALAWLSHQVPTVLTLHDAWLLSGHCAHSLDCERWRIGCGECPDLARYPAVRRDATAFNWKRKREIYQRSRLYVTTPCRWLMEKVETSMLAPAIADRRIIPNGVDLDVFQPNERKQVRASLGLPQEARILLFTANGIRANIWKDYQTLRDAIGRVAESLHGKQLLFVALGDNGPTERIAQAEIRFVPYQTTPSAVAAYYQAADLYVHAARADTFPNTILEALACGTPVVATAVGGISEQVRGLKTGGSTLNQFSLQEATGFLTAPGGAEELGARLRYLLENEEVRLQLSTNAAADARMRFGLERQAQAYIDWYRKIIADFARDDTKHGSKANMNWKDCIDR
jgi:glycosyltransferase involved in cell wall biosynthesis